MQGVFLFIIQHWIVCKPITPSVSSAMETAAAAKHQMVNVNHFFQEYHCDEWVVWPPHVSAPFHPSATAQGFSRSWDYLQGP